MGELYQARFTKKNETFGPIFKHCAHAHAALKRLWDGGTTSLENVTQCSSRQFETQERLRWEMARDTHCQWELCPQIYDLFIFSSH